jgi:(5-formylfuran-3-yl)methyl phosphate synthase
MELLVSVRSAAEVGAALSGGADIIDAKEPSHGSLGAVSPDVLAEIAAEMPDDRRLSVVLGDLTDPDDVVSALSHLRLSPMPSPIYLKLGFAGIPSEDRIERLIATAVAASNETVTSSLIVAVAYADSARAGTASPGTISRIAAEAGAAGILLDTHTKDGLGLLSWIGPTALERWVADARTAGMITALAGGLGLEDLERVTAAGPDVLGVRGAACEGGRKGWVRAERVQAIRRRLSTVSGSVQGA